MPEPAPVLHEFCRATLGNIADLRFRGWDHGESLAWKISTTAGKSAYLKAHRQGVKFRQELHAYRQWYPALARRVPQLLAQREEEPRALLLSALPGVPLKTLQLKMVTELDVHHQAGRLLARLHGQPVGGGTSKYAYDGSGIVKRNKNNAALATFASGKQYNADLNAAYNIAARHHYYRYWQQELKLEKPPVTGGQGNHDEARTSA